MTDQGNEEQLNRNKLPQSFEQGPIRPPSEARSLLIRVTRNCPWNRCEFCHTYRGLSFSRRTTDEILAEIDLIHDIDQMIRTLSNDLGKGGRIDEEMIRFIASMEETEATIMTVAVWLYWGGQSVFLQDANSLVIPLDDLVTIIQKIVDRFPDVTRITSYARSQTLSRMKPGSLERLRAAGLTRIHVGMETGNDKLLKSMKKGTTAQQHIQGGCAVRQAGIELSEYVILGLGGSELWREHALDSAAALSAIDPEFIRFRTLALPRQAPLFQRWKSGSFTRLSDDDIIREEKLLIEHLEGIHSMLVSDHITNLLETVEGKLPDDRDKMLSGIDDYLTMSDQDRTLFQIARRFGWCRHPQDITIPAIRLRAEDLSLKAKKQGFTSIDEFLWEMSARFI